MSQYVVFRYVPDPANGEFVNFGIMAYDGERSITKWLTNWDRLKAFTGDTDVSFLTDFAGDFHGQAFSGAEIDKMVRNFANCIQLAPPRGSIRAVDDLADTVAAWNLKG